MADNHEQHNMSEDLPATVGEHASSALDMGGPAGPAGPAATAYFGEPEEPGGIDLRRYLHAVLRHKWWIMAAAFVGVAASVAAWRFTPVEYTAEGSLWLEVAPRPGGSGVSGDVTPIRASGLLEANAWIELLRSFTVMDSVVVSERLYLDVDPEYAPAFQSLSLAESFRPGSYTIATGPDGRAFALTASNGVLIQEGTLGEPVGADVGLVWTPRIGDFGPGAEVDFTVLHPRDAGRALSEQLVTRIDQRGNFLRLTLPGREPERIAGILNSLMERHVEVAAEIKSGRLDETVEILEEQLGYTEAELADAEQDLEEFRVQTITLPSDQAIPIAPGSSRPGTRSSTTISTSRSSWRPSGETVSACVPPSTPSKKKGCAWRRWSRFPRWTSPARCPRFSRNWWTHGRRSACYGSGIPTTSPRSAGARAHPDPGGGEHSGPGS